MSFGKREWPAPGSGPVPAQGEIGMYLIVGNPILTLLAFMMVPAVGLVPQSERLDSTPWRAAY